jgi:hypothetical protein
MKEGEGGGERMSLYVGESGEREELEGGEGDLY